MSTAANAGDNGSNEQEVRMWDLEATCVFNVLPQCPRPSVITNDHHPRPSEVGQLYA